MRGWKKFKKPPVKFTIHVMLLAMEGRSIEYKATKGQARCESMARYIHTTKIVVGSNQENNTHRGSI